MSSKKNIKEGRPSVSRIAKIDALEILDSRGNPTLEATVVLEDGSKGVAKVPSGASTGEHEACELRDGDTGRYMGKGVLKAVENVRTELSDLLVGKEADDQKAIDKMMIEADGTPNKSRLGANAILGVSLGVARAMSASKKIELFEYLKTASQWILPCPMMNIINGGAHADNSLEFQEFMIRPHGAPSFSEAVRWGAEVFHVLKKELKEKGHVTGVGDEGGFAPNLKSDEEALETIMHAIEKAGFRPGAEVSIALDCASSELFDRELGAYVEVKKRRAGGSFWTKSSEQMIEHFERLVRSFPIDSIEDGLDENDWSGWSKLYAELGSRIQIVGDDIFVTNKAFLSRGLQEKAANSILIKLNQIGTVTETLETIAMAQKDNWTTVISHRSGETGDTTISDLSVAVGSGQIKTGSLCRSDRVEKYNRLLEIEAMLGSEAKFQDSNPFSPKKGESTRSE